MEHEPNCNYYAPGMICNCAMGREKQITPPPEPAPTDADSVRVQRVVGRLRERYERRMKAIESKHGFHDNLYLIGLRDAHLDVIRDLRAEEEKPPNAQAERP